MDIVKTCRIHGPLTREQVNITSKNGKFKCKACHKICKKKYYEANKEKLREKQRIYKAKDPVAYNLMKKVSRKKHQHKYKANRLIEARKRYHRLRDKETERNRLYKKNACALLSDSYIKLMIVRESGDKGQVLSRKDITPEMIMIKRVILEIKRRFKKFNKETLK